MIITGSARNPPPGREYSTPPGTMTVGPVRRPSLTRISGLRSRGFFSFCIAPRRRSPCTTLEPENREGARISPGPGRIFDQLKFTNKSNLVQRFPSRVLRTVSKPPLYVFAHALHSDIKVLYTTGMARTYYERFNSHLSCHKNPPIIVPVLSLAIKKIK